MKILSKIILLILAYLVIIWRTISWYEADKELKYPFASVKTGGKIENVLKILETCNYLSYQITDVNIERELNIYSNHNLRSSSRIVCFKNSEVLSNTYLERYNLAQISAWTAIILLFSLIIIHLAAFFEIPIKFFVLGSNFSKAPSQLRFKSMLILFVYIFGIIFMLDRVNVIQAIGLTQIPEMVAMFFAVLFCANAFRGILSKNKWEINLHTSLSFIISSCFVGVALNS